MNKILIIFLFVLSYPTYAYISENIVNGCDVVSHYEPVFVPIQYTCGSGYFLPANTNGCRACPTGYTCPGGTYSFNELNAQGLNIQDTITQSTSNTCSVNFFHSGASKIVYLTPVFVPTGTVLTVKFKDGENTTTTNCTYGEELTVPPAPAPRVGYVFTGWKVKND